MNAPDDLMSFLTSATQHVSLNQERLAEALREGYTQTVESNEEEVAQTDQPEQQLERLSEEEHQELISQAMANLGLGTTQAPEEIVEQYISSTETELSKEEDLPVEERPIVIPSYSSIREELVRFSDAEWFNKVQEKVIVLAGVGGIGSNMAVILAKLNPSAVYIFDDDLVEPYNLAGQFYSNEDVGKPKVEALAASVTKYTNYSSIFAINRRYLPGEEIVSDIMVCGFDNMRARRDYFRAWKSHCMALPEEQRENCLFIDGRLSADEFQIFCITGHDDYYIHEYETKYLFNDYEAQREVCSYKQTGFLADMIGAFMVNLIVNFCANQVNPLRNMALPFMTSYRSSMMFLDFKR